MLGLTRSRTGIRHNPQASIWLRLAAGVAFLTCGVQSFAQDLGSLEWFKSEWRAAESVSLPRETFLHYSLVLPVEGDASDLAALAKRIEGRPDHPDRRHYEALRRQLEHGPRTVTYRLWYKDARRWRLAADYSEGEVIPYVDVAINGDNAWQMTPRALRLIDPDRPPESLDPSARLTAAPNHYRAWITWRFGPGPLDLQPVASRLVGNRWEATVRSSDGSREFRYLGTVQDGRIHPDRIVMVRADDRPGLANAETRFTDWEYSAFADRWIPASITSVSAEHHQEQILHELRPLRPGEWEPVVATPTLDGEDPLRGPTTFVSVFDHRPGANHAETINEDGSVVRSPIPETPTTGPRSRRLQTVGWFLAGAIAAWLIFLRLRRAG